jgi:methylglutaconyl-CoA hydratase
MTTNDDASPPVPESGRVHLSVADGIGTVEFFHPKGNSLPSALLRELAAGITTLGNDPAARVIVLRSAGTGAFCAGASFDEFTALSEPAQGKDFFLGFSLVIMAMIRAPKFVITRVHGRAAGGALGVIAASDYSFATDNAHAKLSELQVGIGPFVVGVVLERKLGLAPFMNLAVHADWHDPAWLERHGLYSQVCEHVTALDAIVHGNAVRLAAYNPEAMAEMKKVFWRNTDDWESLMAERAAMSGRMVLSDFTRDALAKFRAR